MKIIDPSSFVDALRAAKEPYHQGYFAMYSSILDGIITDPALMLIPIDDHMVHRGDGVFEAFKCMEGCIYNLTAHLVRLRSSAAVLSLKVPWSDDEILGTVAATLRAGGKRECMIRLYVSRGPGGFGVSPYESVRQQMYVVVTGLNQPFMVLHPEGARVVTSLVPPKEADLAGIKNTNYIINSLMKKESVDQGVDFVAGFDDRGNMTEGATENLGVVTREGRLVFPRAEGTLRGTTMMRIMELAEPLVAGGDLQAAGTGDISRDTIACAREMLVVGTTLNVVAVREYDGKPVGDGKPGPVYRALSELLQEDMRTNREMLTDVFGDG